MGQRERGVAKGTDLQSAERLSDIESALVHRNSVGRDDADSYERVGFVASEQNADSRHRRRLEQAEPKKWRPSVPSVIVSDNMTPSVCASYGQPTRKGTKAADSPWGRPRLSPLDIFLIKRFAFLSKL